MSVLVRRFRSAWTTGLIAVFLVAGLTSGLADAGEKGSSRPRSLKFNHDVQRVSDARRTWSSLSQAVKAGVLDKAVATALEHRGNSVGLVEFDARMDVLTSLVGGSARLASVQKGLRSLPGRLRILKSSVLTKIAGVSTLNDYRFLPTTLVRFTSVESLLRVLNHESVLAVRHDAIQKKTLAESLPLIGQPASMEAGFGGRGAAVVVLDSGVDYKRSAFGNCSSVGVPVGCRVIAAADFAPNDFRLDAGDFHGTNVSGIVAGVAPDARLLVGDIFKGNAAKVSWVLDGLDWALENKKDGIDVRSINLSLGVPYSYYDKTCSASPYTSSFSTLRSFGILPVVAAGNYAFDQNGFRSGVAFPACTPGALSVAATYDSNIGRKDWGDCLDKRTRPDKVVCWTQSGKTVGLFAPGVFITAAGIKMPGTSQAAPHVAGAAAVLGSAYPGASVSQIAAALKNSGPEVYDPGPKITRHRLDIPAALNTLLAGLETTPPAVSTPVQFLPMGIDVIPPDVPVAAQWSATDASGIHEYAVQISENGTWYTVATEANGSTEALVDLTAGNRYQFAVAARDKAGNWSDWSYGPEFVPEVYQENHGSLVYTPGWERLAWSEAFGGYQMSSVTPEASASFAFSGFDVAWVGTSSPQNGFAEIQVDGAAQDSVDTFNLDGTYPRLVLSSWHWPSPGSHSMQVSVLGDGQVDVDAFLVLRP